MFSEKFKDEWFGKTQKNREETAAGVAFFFGLSIPTFFCIHIGMERVGTTIVAILVGSALYLSLKALLRKRREKRHRSSNRSEA